MKIIKHFNDILFGELVTLMITGDSVTICQGKNSVKYEFPKTFQDYNYLNHTEEMACYDSAGTTELGSLGRKSVCSF